jgi:hypothetical protein
MNKHHATDYEVAEGHEYPTPFCGAAGFDRDLLLPFSTFIRLAEEGDVDGADVSDFCWECRSLLS